jgi:hypothetical protein
MITDIELQMLIKKAAKDLAEIDAEKNLVETMLDRISKIRWKLYEKKATMEQTLDKLEAQILARIKSPIKGE